MGMWNSLMAILSSQSHHPLEGSKEWQDLSHHFYSCDVSYPDPYWALTFAPVINPYWGTVQTSPDLEAEDTHWRPFLKLTKSVTISETPFSQQKNGNNKTSWQGYYEDEMW